MGWRPKMSHVIDPLGYVWCLSCWDGVDALDAMDCDGGVDSTCEGCGVLIPQDRPQTDTYVPDTTTGPVISCARRVEWARQDRSGEVMS